MIPDDILLTHGEVREFARRLQETSLACIGIPVLRAVSLDLAGTAASLLGRTRASKGRYDQLGPELETIVDPWTGWPEMPEDVFSAVVACRAHYHRQRLPNLAETAARFGISKADLCRALRSGPIGRRGGWALMLLQLRGEE